ncbi:MAG: hypothetical protein KF789_10600 [Bdellovibrionaceae bacterium]|nr:hypothetical protein [Pseudobdellovibrionaceae bacterium]
MLLSITVVILYCTVFFVTALAMAPAFRLKHILGYRALIGAMFAHCFIAMTALAIYSVDDFQLKVQLSRLRFLGLSLLSPCLLIFVNSLYGKWRWVEKKWGLALLFSPASITWTLTLIPSLQDFLVTDFAPLQVGGLSVLTFRGGPWFPGHIFTSYFCSMTTFLIAGIQFFRAKGVKRTQTLFFNLSFGFVSIVDLYCVASGSEWRWSMMSGAIFVFASSAIVYIGLKHQMFNVIPYATERIFRSLRDPILVVSKNNRLQTANEAALKIFDLGRDSFGKTLSELSPLNLTDQSEIQVDKRHFDVVVESIGGAFKHTQGRIIYLREVTARKQAERSLETHLDFKSKMLSLIAHDAVGHVQAQTSLMQQMKTHDGPNSTRAIELLTDSHGSLHEFLRNILNWEKSQDHSFQVTRRAFDVRLFVDAGIESVHLATELRQIQIETVFHLADQPIITADSEMLLTVLRNLLSNAIRATPDGGTVQIQVNTEPKRFHLEVIDHGAGMSSERVAFLMESEVAFPSITSETGGFGVGLFMAKHLLRLHQGKLWIESRQGMGTRAGFSVPL